MLVFRGGIHHGTGDGMIHVTMSGTPQGLKQTSTQTLKELFKGYLQRFTNIYIYIYYPPPPADLLFRRCMRRKEQMRYTFCFVKKVRRWHWSRRTWYDLDAACNLALSRCHSLCSILPQQSRGKAPLVLMGRADRLYGYMRRTKLNDEFCIGKSSIAKWLAKHVVLHTCNIS